MIKSIRILLAIAAYYDYEIWRMDVKTAFLNGHLQEEIYMDQPEGFISKHEEKKKNNGSAIVFLVLYVDDILMFGNDIGMFTSVKLWLSKTFSMKDLGNASYVLGIKIYRDRTRKLIGLSQSLYVDKVLGRFQMEHSKKGFLPVRHDIHLLMYAMLCTRPYINYAVSITSRYQSNPGSKHWSAVKTVLKYLRRTKDMFLVYGGNPELLVEGYTDSYFESYVHDRKSTSKYVFTLNGGAISWRCYRQSTTADSTTEVEYIVASEAKKEVI
ncbi:unnamed protein product [Prunus armeniaca]